jgi:hypothetical protein
MTEQLIAAPAECDALVPPRFETKIAVVLRRDLPTWQKLNLTAFVVSGAAESIGADYVDADGTRYLPMFGQPVMVFAADHAQLTRTLERALRRDVVPAIFTADLFATGHDAANRAAVAAVAREDLSLVGIGLRASRKVVDKITAGLRLHD